MAGSDCFLAYIKSSLGLNFAVLVSSDDNISSLKRKAEAHHLSLFPHHAGIVARTIKIMQQGTVYFLHDAIPVSFLFEGADRKCFLLMDAEAVPPNPLPQTSLSANVSRGRDLPEGLLNQDGDPRCTSKAPNRKLPEGTTNKDTNVEEMNADKVAPSNDRESLRAGDTMQEINVASENENTGMHLMNSCIVTGNPADVSRGRDLPEGLLNQDGDPRCTSKAPNRKLPGGITNKDTTVEEKNADKVTPSNDRESLRAGDTMQEINAASENENTGMHLMNSCIVTGNPDDAARSRDLTEGLLNQDDDTRCTSKAPNRKLPEGTTDRDTIGEEMNADKVAPSNERESLRAGDTMREVNAASKNENTGMHPINSSLVTRIPALLLNIFSNGKESGMALEKENRKEVGDDGWAENAGEMPSLVPRGNDSEDNSLNKIKSSHLSDLNCSGRVISDSQIDDNTLHSLPASNREINLDKTEQASQPILVTNKGKNKSREDGRHKVGKLYYYGKLTSDSINASEVKKKKRKQEAEKLDDSAHSEQGKKRVRRVAYKTPLAKLAQNFDNSGSNIAGSGRKTHAKEVSTSGVGDTSLEFKEKNQKEEVPEELRCQRRSCSGWHCPIKALADGKYCFHHCKKKPPK